MRATEIENIIRPRSVRASYTQGGVMKMKIYLHVIGYIFFSIVVAVVTAFIVNQVVPQLSSTLIPMDIIIGFMLGGIAWFIFYNEHK
jgi:hypothetical protein